MTPDEILKLWRDYEGRGSDAVVAFARSIELAQRELCVKACEDLAFQYEAYLPRYRKSKHPALDTLISNANTARVLADKIKFL